MQENEKAKNYGGGYGIYFIVWLTLVGLTTLTVGAAGVNLGSLALFAALAIAAVKSSFVINIFMHIKYDHPIFKVFIIVALTTLLSVIILMTFDFYHR